MAASPSHRLLPLLGVSLIVPAAALLRGADWPDWRGPARTGVSTETGLADDVVARGREPRLAGALRRPLGPVVFGNRLYLQNTSGARRRRSRSA